MLFGQSDMRMKQKIAPQRFDPFMKKPLQFINCRSEFGFPFSSNGLFAEHDDLISEIHNPA